MYSMGMDIAQYIVKGKDFKSADIQAWADQQGYQYEQNKAADQGEAGLYHAMGRMEGSAFLEKDQVSFVSDGHRYEIFLPVEKLRSHLARQEVVRATS